MDISFEQYQQIQQYLDNTMPAEEKAAFEILLEKDSFLKDNFLFEKQLREGLERMYATDDMENYDYTPQKKGHSPLDDPMYMRKLIDEAGKNFTSSQKSDDDSLADKPSYSIPGNEHSDDGAKFISIGALAKLAIAACVLLAVAGIVWVAINKKEGGPQIVHNNPGDTAGLKKQQDQIAHGPVVDSGILKSQERKSSLATLFKAFFEKDALPDDTPQLLAMVFDDYADNNYKGLQQLNIDDLPISRDVHSSEDDRRVRELGHYYKGIAELMEHGDTKAAIYDLQWAADSISNPVLNIKAQWYLALAFLRNNNPGQSITQLKKLAANDAAGIYKRKAQDLLKKMEE